MLILYFCEGGPPAGKESRRGLGLPSSPLDQLLSGFYFLRYSPVTPRPLNKLVFSELFCRCSAPVAAARGLKYHNSLPGDLVFPLILCKHFYFPLQLQIVELRTLGWQSNPLINAYYKQRLYDFIVYKFRPLGSSFTIMTGSWTLI